MSGNVSNITSSLAVVAFNSQTTVFVVLAVVIIFFNGGVLLAMWKEKILQKPENYLLASLAVSDLSVGLFGLPLGFICSYTPQYLCALCFGSFAFFKFISVTTLLHIFAIIRERYLLVVRPLLYHRIRRNIWRSKKIVASLWAVSLTAASIPWSWWRVDCSIEEDEASISTWNHDLYYELSSFVLFFIFPLTFITFFLLKIFSVARSHARGKTIIGSSCRKQRTKAEGIFVILLAMFLIFVICWLPFLLVVILDNFAEPTVSPWLVHCVLILRCLTAILNPVLYTFYKKDFFQILKREAQKLLCCNETCRRHTATKSSRQDSLPLERIGDSPVDLSKG